MKVWQIATGEPNRDYQDLFFDHDIMILGPAWHGEATTGAYAKGSPNSVLRQVHNFAHKPKPGDRVIARLGHEVIGIGQIPEGDEYQYSFNETFKRVYGWDLRHCRRVAWAERCDLGALTNVFRKAKQKPSFTQVHESHIVEMVRAIDDSLFAGPIEDLPVVDTSLYEEEELGVELFRAGISNRNIGDILAALQQAERLCSWYQSEDCKRNPSENEVVSHIILPLFLGLGWSHQQIAVEWQRVDMAFFQITPEKEEVCVMVLEAKGLGQGLGDVLRQPIGYIEQLNLSHVRYILTTDGANLFVYERLSEDWKTSPVGYLDVSSLQRQYVLPTDTNLVQTLVMLQPSQVWGRGPAVV